MASSVKWLIEKDIFREDAPDRMSEIVMKKGMQVLRIQRIPFSDSFAVLGDKGKLSKVYSSNLPFDTADCVVVYGSLNICQQLMSPRRWYPTAWFDLERFRCASYYAHWGQHLVNDAINMMPWAVLRRNKDYLFQELGDPFFVKPDTNLKLFSGKTVGAAEFEKWADMNQDCYEIPPEALVLVSPCRPLGKEWRMVVCGGKVITGSQYKICGETVLSPEVPHEAFEYAAKIAAEPWQPGAVYALDLVNIGKNDLIDLRILEIGPFNGAGMYQCDLEKIVDAVSIQALKEWENRPGKGWDETKDR